jgi:hypothetical protein
MKVTATTLPRSDSIVTFALSWEVRAKSGAAPIVGSRLSNGGTLEKAQMMAAHESPRMTELYDQRCREPGRGRTGGVLIRDSPDISFRGPTLPPSSAPGKAAGVRTWARASLAVDRRRDPCRALHMPPNALARPDERATTKSFLERDSKEMGTFQTSSMRRVMKSATIGDTLPLRIISYGLKRMRPAPCGVPPACSISFR